MIHGAYMTLRSPGAGMVDSRRALAVLVIEKQAFLLYLSKVASITST
jgi:hypothetical protein